VLALIIVAFVTLYPPSFLAQKINWQIAQPGCSHPGCGSPHREAIKHRLDGPPLIGREKRRKKAIRTADCLSEASFRRAAFF
jgi:hypothetical protein